MIFHKVHINNNLKYLKKQRLIGCVCGLRLIDINLVDDVVVCFSTKRGVGFLDFKNQKSKIKKYQQNKIVVGGGGDNFDFACLFFLNYQSKITI